MSIKSKVKKIVKKVTKKVSKKDVFFAELPVCESCKGTGRGELHGLQVTTCPVCNGTGK